MGTYNDVHMLIVNDLGFSGYAAPLHIVVVIFRERVLIESGT